MTSILPTASVEALSRVRIVLCRTSHPGNIGAAARAMLTMGLADLVLVDPKEFPSAQADARASGAQPILQSAHVVETLEEALQGCVFAIACTARARGLTHVTVGAREACIEAARLIQASEQNRVAIVFGNERSGMSNEEVLLCQLAAHIPTTPDYSSLTVAAAVQVFTYELRMAAGLVEVPSSKSDSFPLATHEGVEGFYAHLEKTLIEIGYLDPENPRKLMPRFRRLFGRSRLEKEEIDLLRGILTKVTHPRRYG